MGSPTKREFVGGGVVWPTVAVVALAGPRWAAVAGSTALQRAGEPASVGPCEKPGYWPQPSYCYSALCHRLHSRFARKERSDPMAEGAEALRLTDWVIAGCTLAGPILAVQAQKWVEGFREKKARRLAIFRTLMATRATNLSPAHVEALNSVPIDFYKDKRVMDAWEEYFMHLTTEPEHNPAWGTKRLDLFIKLLALIGTKVGYDFNVAQMNRIYFPRAHGDLDVDQEIIRKRVVALLNGDTSLPIEIKAAPVSPDTVALQNELTSKMSKAYNEDGSLKVTIIERGA